mgnify:CR=1 FL=1
MARGRHPGMQQKASHFCHPGAGRFQAARRRQALQAEGLAALMRTHGNTIGNGTAEHTLQAGVIMRLQLRRLPCPVAPRRRRGIRGDHRGLNGGHAVNLQ